MYKSFENSLNPYFTFNTILAKATESAITEHLKNVEEFTKIGLENFYSGMNARTLEDVVAFSKKQPEIMQKASALFVKRSENYADLSHQLYKSTQELFNNNVKDVDNKVTNTEYDLGESTIVRKPKKKSVKSTKAPVTKKKATESPKSKTKAPAKKKTIAKASSNIKETENKTKKATTEPLSSPSKTPKKEVSTKSSVQKPADTPIQQTLKSIEKEKVIDKKNAKT